MASRYLSEAIVPYLIIFFCCFFAVMSIHSETRPSRLPDTLLSISSSASTRKNPKSHPHKPKSTRRGWGMTHQNLICLSLRQQLFVRPLESTLFASSPELCKDGQKLQPFGVFAALERCKRPPSKANQKRSMSFASQYTGRGAYTRVEFWEVGAVAGLARIRPRPFF